MLNSSYFQFLPFSFLPFSPHMFSCSHVCSLLPFRSLLPPPSSFAFFFPIGNSLLLHPLHFTFLAPFSNRSCFHLFPHSSLPPHLNNFWCIPSPSSYTSSSNLHLFSRWFLIFPYLLFSFSHLLPPKLIPPYPTLPSFMSSVFPYFPCSTFRLIPLTLLPWSSFLPFISFLLFLFLFPPKVLFFYLHRSPSSLLPSDNLTSSSTHLHSFHVPPSYSSYFYLIPFAPFDFSAAVLPSPSFHLFPVFTNSSFFDSAYVLPSPSS